MQTTYINRIRELREDSDKTQCEVAAYLHVSQTAYSGYERGRNALPVEFLAKLADFYGVSADFILGRTDNPDFKI